MSDRQKLIRHRAYEIWQQAGQPSGSPEDHWYQAEHEIESETDARATDEDANLNAERKVAVEGRADDGEPPHGFREQP